MPDLEINVSNIYYNYYNYNISIIINATNMEDTPITIESPTIQGHYGYYSTHDVPNSAPQLPLELEPGETTTLTIATVYYARIIELDVYSEIQVLVELSEQPQPILINTTIVRSATR